jgi:hypothetical protein
VLYQIVYSVFGEKLFKVTSTALHGELGQYGGVY